jgi:SAM-dependent methyltransferase
MTDNKSEAQARWEKYYELSRHWPPREFLVKNVGRFDSPGFAIDLGSGTGTDSRFLLEKGWEVLAIDAQEIALTTLLSLTLAEHRANLQTRQASFEKLSEGTLALPPADLIWAGNSLPFCHPDHFESLWDTILTVLKPNGRLIGDLFGPRHAWASHESMNFHSKEDVLNLLDGLTLEYLAEEEGQQPTTQGYQHWHAFTFCAQKVL